MSDVIEKAIPIPPGRLRDLSMRSRLRQMTEVGDSTRVGHADRSAVSMAIRYMRAREGWSFTTRVLVDEVAGEKYIRVWRTA